MNEPDRGGGQLRKWDTSMVGQATPLGTGAGNARRPGSP